MEIPPIQSPQNQKAHGVFGGLEFQCWHTLNEWINLKQGEFLFVECAEDYAVFRDKSADIKQAKRTSTAISLRSPDVLEALNHFGEFLKQSNHKIKFCFVSTSSIRKEKGQPFQEEAGLEFWKRIQKEGEKEDYEKLRDFLLSDSSISKTLNKDLVEYLSSQEIDALVDEFFASIVWDLDQPDTREVEELVVEKLGSLLISKFGFPFSHAANLSKYLFVHIYKIGSESTPIALDSNNLMGEIERHLVPSKLSEIQAIQTHFISSYFAGATEIEIGRNLPTLVPPIAVNPCYSKRETTVRHIWEELSLKRVMLLEGSSGMGKSTLAQLVSLEAKVRSLHLNNRDCDKGMILRGLRECIVLITQSPDPVFLIVDDLPWEKCDESMFATIRTLVKTSFNNNCYLIFANYKCPSVANLNRAALDGIEALKVPELTDDEIIEVAENLGCPDNDQKGNWISAIALYTSRHPQLVHAAILSLKQTSWPKFTAEGLAETGSVVKTEQRQRSVLLAHKSKSEVELLGRLSVFFRPFSRRQALGLANNPSRLDSPVITFENLCGPWVEQISEDRYQVTPIIGRSLLDDEDQEYLEQLNAAAAKTIISTKNLGADEGANALIHSIIGNEPSVACNLALRFLTSPEQDSSWIHPFLEPLLYLELENKKGFEEETGTLLILRVLQFSVSSTISPDCCEKYLCYCDELMDRFESDVVRYSFSFILSYTIFGAKNANLSIKRLMWASGILHERLPEIEKEISTVENDKSDFAYKFLSQTDRDFMCSSLIWTRIKTILDLQNLVGFLSELDPVDRGDTLEWLCSTKALVINGFSVTWLDIEHASEEVQRQAVEDYKSILKLSKEWKCSLFSVSASKCISVLQNEYLGESKPALEVLQQVIPTNDDEVFFHQESYGKVYQQIGDYPLAMECYRKALDNLPSDEFSQHNLGNLLHQCGVVAGKGGKWEDSASYFDQGYEANLSEGELIRAGGFAADAAFSYSMLGDWSKSVKYLALALRQCDIMPDFRSDLYSLKVQKLVANAVLRIRYSGVKEIQPETSAPLYFGMCSELGTYESMRKSSPPYLEMAWVFLLEIEFRRTDSSLYWDGERNRILRSKNCSVRFMFFCLETQRLLRERDFSETYIQSCVNAEIAGFVQKNCSSDLAVYEINLSNETSIEIPIAEQMVVPYSILTGLMVLSSETQSIESTWNDWKNTIKNDDRISSASDWLDTCDKLIFSQIQQAIPLLKVETDHWNLWCLGIRLLREPVLDAKTLFLLNLRILEILAPRESLALIKDLIEIVDRRISDLWIKACKNKFQFRSPIGLVSEIENVASAPDGSISHVANLLLVAQERVGVNLSGSFLSYIRKHAN